MLRGFPSIPVAAEIIGLQNAPLVQEAKNDEAIGLSYGAALRIVQKKLKCLQHTEPNRWCYIRPENRNEHIALGKEEVSLWAREIVCIVP